MRKCLSHQHVQVQLTALQCRHCAHATATTIIRQQTFLEPDKSSHVAQSTVTDTNKGVCLRFSEQGVANRQTYGNPTVDKQHGWMGLTLLLLLLLLLLLS